MQTCEISDSSVILFNDRGTIVNPVNGANLRNLNRSYPRAGKAKPSISMEEEDDFLSSDSHCSGSDDDEYEEGDGESQQDQEESSADSPPSDEDRKSQNVAALVRGNLVVKRQPLLPRVLSVSEGAAVARKPFKPPCSNGYRDQNGELVRRLWARKRFVPWGSSRPALVAINNRFSITTVIEKDVLEESEPLPPGVEPLVLWQAEESEEGGGDLAQIVVDPLLVRFLRPHQREGVQFMFECVSGLSSSAGIAGCILADDMGLGKTLQSITLLYTLLHQGFDGKPMVKRAMIVTPTSLVSNWESEINKWVGERVQLISLCESTRADVVSGVDSFLRACSPYQVLIISYETFRMHSAKFEKSGCCDLLICDEAHRLKNDQTLTNRALAALPCSRRILLSGTPMQNDLEEFFAMVNFTNPGVLGDAAYFRRYYEILPGSCFGVCTCEENIKAHLMLIKIWATNQAFYFEGSPMLHLQAALGILTEATPIICGREPTATAEERALGLERSAELSAKVNQFILRRTNALLSNHLPPKIVEVVCCKLTPLQSELYYHFIHSKNVKRAIVEEMKRSKILAYITALKKLCNHPKLIYDTIRSGGSGTSGFEDCIRFFPPELFSGRSGSWSGGDGIWVEMSGKMHVLARLLAHLRQKTDDRIVLVSNYTQTLDLFAQLCRERRYPYLRLDGTTSIGKRQKLVNSFNDPSKDEFVFLLSSKAGGCGLNLIGGNRLVLFDPDWNPANDKQAAARVWRDGQKKRVYIYRFLSTGTIEEKVYQRQMSKEGLQKVIQQDQTDSMTPQGNFLSTEDLRDLFTFHADVRSEIHENMNCIRCKTDDLSVDDSSEDVTEVVKGRDSTNGKCQAEEGSDIGGFAEIAGCLHKLQSSEKQLGTPLEEDLGSWGHHTFPTSVPDVILQASAGDEVTFVFTNQVDGKLIPIESMRSLKAKDLSGPEDSLQAKRAHNQTHMPQSLRHLEMHSPTQTIPVLPSNEDPSRSLFPTQCKSLESGMVGLQRTSKGLRAPRKPRISHENKLPLKRASDDFDKHEDDFV